VELGTQASILDVELPEGGETSLAVPSGFQGFVYMLEGEAAFGDSMRRANVQQLVLLGPGDELRVTNASAGTRFMLMAGQPYGETPRFNGPYVD
jgi:redox-sensitive bicupin YhaK (pirin superfamily)